MKFKIGDKVRVCNNVAENMYDYVEPGISSVFIKSSNTVIEIKEIKSYPPENYKTKQKYYYTATNDCVYIEEVLSEYDFAREIMLEIESIL